MAERALAHIEKIEWIKPIDGADRIELVGILGWECVAGKGEFKVGDVCVYHEIDSRVPINKPVYAFMEKNDGKVKTRKFKGVLSQGLALSLDKFDIDLSKYKVGDDVTKLLGITKIQTDEEKRLYEWNARVQITTWGNRTCADDGGLRDYAHKEWNGILKDFYYKRWSEYWKTLQDVLDGKQEVKLDYYAMEEPWTLENNHYSSVAEGDCIDVAMDVFNRVFGK